MTFTRPKMGPKVYLSRGSSGHAETFDRLSSDRNLMLLLGEAKAKLAVEGFLRKMSLDHSVRETWTCVSDYLAEMSGLDVEHIAIDIIIAFWAAVARARDAAALARRAQLVPAFGVN